MNSWAQYVSSQQQSVIARLSISPLPAVCIVPIINVHIIYVTVIYVLAHQTEIAILFAWVIKFHLTQVFSPRQKKIAQNLEINQILGVVVQEKESNMVFCSRWKFPTLGMTVLSGTSAEPRFRSARSSLGLETYI